MNDPRNRIAAMLRQVAQPVRMPRPAPVDDAEEAKRGGIKVTLPTPINREQVVGRVAADNRSRDLGMRAFEKADQGQELDPNELDIAEAIVLLELRPCIDIRNDTFGDLPAEWTQLAHFRPVIDKAIRSVGRVEVPNLPSMPYGGTGFVVGKNLLLTNRHVAELFTEGVGQKKLLFQSQVGTAIDFRQEIDDPTPPRLLKVRKTKLIHPYWDAALLQVDGLPENQMMTLAANEPRNLAGRAVVVIGFPMRDTRNDLAKQQEIFRGIFGKKRLLPGTLMGKRQVRSFGNLVEALTHDSSTLGGNSGSLVLDLETGNVVGLHFAGRYMDANFAVPTWELANDKHLTKLNFDEAIRPDGFTLPDWLDRWKSL